jgi:hypothetical protein
LTEIQIRFFIATLFLIFIFFVKQSSNPYGSSELFKTKYVSLDSPTCLSLCVSYSYPSLSLSLSLSFSLSIYLSIYLSISLTVCVCVCAFVLCVYVDACACVRICAFSFHPVNEPWPVHAQFSHSSDSRFSLTHYYLSLTKEQAETKDACF